MSRRAKASQADGRPRMRLLLRHASRDFRLMWGGQALSLFGSQLTGLALPLAVLRFHGSAVDAGLVIAIRYLVTTAARLPAGAVADHLDRRRLMVAADTVRALAMLGISGLLLAGSLPMPVLIPLAAAEGAGTAFFSPAQAAALRHLVGPGDLTVALGLNQARGYTVTLVGPLFGGLLFAFAPWLPFVLDAATYVVSCLCVAAIRGALGGGTASQDPAMCEAISGLRYVLRNRFLLTLTAWAALLNFATAGIGFGLVLVVGPGHGVGVGAAYSAVACAGIVGAMLAPGMLRLPAKAIIIGASVLTPLLCAAVAADPVPAVAIAGLSGITLLAPMIAVPFDSRVYAVVPDEWTGRVQGALFLVGGSIYPFGGVAMGALAQHGSPRLGYAVLTAVLAAVLALTVTPAFLQQLTEFDAAYRPAEPEPPHDDHEPRSVQPESAGPLGAH